MRIPGLAPIFLALGAAAGAGTAAGCDTALHLSQAQLPDAAEAPSCVEANDHSDFAWVRDQVLRPHCAAFSGCHQGGNPAGRLNLTAALAFGALVGVDADRAPGWKRVLAGDPEHSYLLVKLGEVPGPVAGASGQGTTMPPNSPLLCAGKRKAVQRWILDGAREEGLAPDAGPADAPAAGSVADGPPDAPADRD